MVVRVNNLRDWTKLQPGDVIPLDNTQQRRVTIEVNTSAPVLWFGGTRFVGKTDGLDKLIIDLEGPEDIWCTGIDDAAVQEVWFWTQDGSVTAMRYDDSESFVNVMSRAERSPEEERAMATMFANTRRNEERLAKSRQDFEERMAAMEADLEAERKKTAAAEAKALKAEAAKAAAARKKADDENGI